MTAATRPSSDNAPISAPAHSLSVLSTGMSRLRIVQSSERNVQSFDSSLYQLVKQGRIELEEALNNADSRTNLEAKINFG